MAAIAVAITEVADSPSSSRDVIGQASNSSDEELMNDDYLVSQDTSSTPPSDVLSSSSPSSTHLPPLPLCRVDRYWLQKLVLKSWIRNAKDDASVTDMKLDDWSRIKLFAAAPMVDQSDLPYRLQCRRHGTNLCFTPMIHARLFVTTKMYRKRFRLSEASPKEDRPLIAQLCGGTDPETMLECARQLQDYCDGIDINCGCPQGIAKRGNYGAFLLEQQDKLVALVRYMAPRLKVPLSVKVRLLPEEPSIRVAASLDLYSRLVDAGIHLLTIHGRTRHEKGLLTGAADWSAIAQAVQQLSPRIPILANGSIASADDVQECLTVTQADGVMSSEAILEYPPLFAPLHLQQQETILGELGQELEPDDTVSRTRVGRLSLAHEYMKLALQYPPDEGGQGSGFKCIRVHMHRFLHADLQVHTVIRDALVRAQTIDDLQHALNLLEQIHATEHHDARTEELSWYVRHGGPQGGANDQENEVDDRHDKPLVEDGKDEKTSTEGRDLFQEEGEDLFGGLF